MEVCIIIEIRIHVHVQCTCILGGLLSAAHGVFFIRDTHVHVLYHVSILLFNIML